VRMWGVFVVCTLSACASRGPTTTRGRDIGRAAKDDVSASANDAGAPRACTFDAKDLAPCYEDCDRGVALACRLAADRLEHGGDGILHDPSRAVMLNERACELRDALGCTTAARLRGRGVGVRVDRLRQIELLARACNLGEGSACTIAARAFARGEPEKGVVADPGRAKTLWERACVAGVEEACATLDEATPRPP
jgi:TPR repeat protein